LPLKTREGFGGPGGPPPPKLPLSAPPPPGMKYAISYSLSCYRATDINPIAAQCTSQTAKQNGVSICCVITDLVSDACW